ncbi:MAG: acyl-CoA dehydrogenase family protein [Pseudomonadota bacterium]
MDFTPSETQAHWAGRVRAFMNAHVVPAQARYRAELAEGPTRWRALPVVEELKEKAKAEGLWNLFLAPSAEHDEGDYRGAGLSNLEYAPCAEEMGRIPWASEVFNCSAPDTGNMEVLHRYGTPAQKERWLKPLLAGEIRSAFAMTEPGVASSDATNIATTIERDGDDYVLNGRKWWISGAGDPRCKLFILLGRSNPDAPRHARHAQILVPADAPGITIERPLPVFGYDDAPHGHCEIRFNNVRVPAENMVLGEGRGFEVAQGRLGPGRIHHCMRTIGLAEMALDSMVGRILTREAFGKRIGDHSVWEERVATARMDIEMTRLLCLKAADMMDKVGNKVAQREIAMIKVAGPRVALNVLDDAIQAHGGGGVSDDFPLAAAYALVRTLRFADGPDEVHNRALARIEYRRHQQSREA